jgi:hypothetical protein
MDLDAAATELYALTPDDFIAARSDAAKAARAAGDRELAAEITKLRRPTQPAWMVNQLVRRERAAVDQLLDLGDELRAAQQALDAAELRRLASRRTELIDQLGRKATQLTTAAGRQATEQVQREVEATLAAAVADPESAAAVREGRLTTALAYAGFGTLELSAGPPRLRVVKPPAPSNAVAETQTRADRQRAEAELRLRQTELDAASRVLARAEQRERELAGALHEARDEVAAARQARDESEAARSRAAERLSRIRE